MLQQSGGAIQSVFDHLCHDDIALLMICGWVYYAGLDLDITMPDVGDPFQLPIRKMMTTEGGCTRVSISSLYITLTYRQLCKAIANKVTLPCLHQFCDELYKLAGNDEYLDIQRGVLALVKKIRLGLHTYKIERSSLL